MVQAHTGPVFSEPDLSQIVSLCDPLDTPFGAVDGCGYFLYINPALEALMEQCGGVDSSTRLGEWIDTSSPCPALETSGNISMNALPFLGRIWLKMEDPASEPVAALLRLEAYGGNGAGFPAALCTIMPYPQASLTLSSAPLLRRWKSRVEEIGDSFDIARVGAKTCKVLESMTQAHAVAFYWLHASQQLDGAVEVVRAEQVGQVRFLADTPESLDLREEWIQLAARKGVMELSALSRALKNRNLKPAPHWLTSGKDGFVLACKARGDLLGLVVVWTETRRLDLAGLGDLLDQVSFQVAQAVDHARWFQFARRSESRSEQLIENANVIILGMDLQGKITLWNRKAREVLGYDPTEVLGRQVFGLFGPGQEQRERASSRFFSALSTGESLAEFETTMVDKEGNVRHVVWNTNVLNTPHGSILGLYAIGQDITRRRELERRLAASERRHRGLVETTHDLYWVLLFPNPENLESGEVAFLNRAFAGYDKEDLLGKSVDAFKRTFQPESWRRFEKACGDVLGAERPIQRIETEHTERGEARTRAFLMHDLFPCYEEDILVGVQGLSIDITAHKEIEAQMLQAQKLESVGTLARGVAHDFNNILNGINGFLYLIQRHSENPDKIVKSSRSIQELVQRAGGLTRQLQTYARQGGRPEKRPLDLNEILRQSLKIIEAGVGRHLDIHLELYEDLEWIEGDRSQIEQVVMNICLNAAEAMPGGGKLTVRTSHAALDRSDSILPENAPNGDYCLVQVSDTGCGMTPQVKARIFDPFFTTKKTGNGLGLSAVYGILKAHQALVKVDSEVCVGTSFTLYFPAVKVKRALLGDTSNAQVRGGNETILVVDDEEPVRIVSQDILSTLGYRVILARDGEAAVRIFQERPHAIDLVLMDIAMPNLNGRSAAKAMRLAQPDLKILFTSGYTDKAQIETLGQDGFPHFLAKPYSMLDLQSAVRRILDGESEKAVTL